MNQAEQQDGRRFRRAISAMAMMAVLGYLVAFSQADKGTVHYKAYSQAYAACYAHVLDTGAQQTECNAVPEVRTHLIKHREAFAVGEPFLNLALSLTVVIVLSPLLRRLVFWLLDRAFGSEDGAARSGSH